MKRAIVLILFFTLGFSHLSFSRAETGRIERSREILEEEGILRKRLEEKEKVFVKRIVVEGATLISEEEIKEIILPFQRCWLGKEEIQEITDSITRLYLEKGCQEGFPRISCRIKKRVLTIQIEES